MWNFVFPGSYVFEGNLVVKALSFTYTGEQNKRFLDTIRGIKALDLQGSQPQPLVLTGKFSSVSDPALNQKLSQLNRLTVELPYADSHLILTPTNSSQPSKVSILDLRINPGSQVNELAYHSKPSRLSFCIQSSSSELEDCRNPSPSDSNVQSKSASLGRLKLQFNQQPLTIRLNYFNSPELGKTDVDAPQERTFQFVPAVDELTLNLLSPTQFFVNLPEPLEAENSEFTNSSQWLRRDIDVKDVTFTQLDTTDNVIEESEISTILSGEVRLGKEVMQVQNNQFLIVLSGKSGIQKLVYLQINTKSPQSSMRVLFSGKSQGIAVGLDPKYPVQKIQPSWLSQYLSQEAVNALLALLGALTGILLPRLFPESNDDRVK